MPTNTYSHSMDVNVDRTSTMLSKASSMYHPQPRDGDFIGVRKPLANDWTAKASFASD